MYSDVIADMFTRIRNAIKERHLNVEIPYSVFKYEISKLLFQNGFIKSFSVNSDNLHKKNINIILKYKKNGNPLITHIERVSKPSKRIYQKKSDISKTRSGFGLSIFSTSKGLISGKDARIKNVGGELIGVVW